MKAETLGISHPVNQQTCPVLIAAEDLNYKEYIDLKK